MPRSVSRMFLKSPSSPWHIRGQAAEFVDTDVGLIGRAQKIEVSPDRTPGPRRYGTDHTDPGASHRLFSLTRELRKSVRIGLDWCVPPWTKAVVMHEDLDS